MVSSGLEMRSACIWQVVLGMVKQSSCLEQAFEVRWSHSCQRVTWHSWAAWAQISTPEWKVGARCDLQPAQQCLMASCAWGWLACLLQEAVSHTSITAWKWLGKYFERQKHFRNHCCVSHTCMEKGEPTSSPWQAIFWPFLVLAAPLPFLLPPSLICLLLNLAVRSFQIDFFFFFFFFPPPIPNF